MPSRPARALSRRTVLAAAGTGAALLGGPAVRPAHGAAGGLPRRTVRARQKFFGEDVVHPRTGAVRPDRVVISWFGCTSYAVAMNGRVLLLDAWVPRGSHSGYVPTGPQEVADLRPFGIFIGHGHFDHARDAGPIARASGARVFGTREHCAQARELAGGPIAVRPVGKESDPLGAVHQVSLRRLEVTAVRHPHSAPRPPDVRDPRAPLVPVPDLSTQLENPPSPEDAVDTCAHAGDAEGGVLLWQFRARGFHLTFHDSVGPLVDDAPQVVDRLRALPRTDVHVGAIQGFGQVTNGMRDVGTYVRALGARVFVPGHHDDWGAPVVATSSDDYRTALEAELARIPQDRRPRLRWMGDPQHYLRPGRLTFRA